MENKTKKELDELDKVMKVLKIPNSWTDFIPFFEIMRPNAIKVVVEEIAKQTSLQRLMLEALLEIRDSLNSKNNGK